jgi:hypothetical protein
MRRKENDMPLIPQNDAHPSQARLDCGRPLRHFLLADAVGAYAAAALAEHPEALELHLTVLRFGPAAVRALRADLEELKVMARAAGKRRIVGLRLESGPLADPRWPKFTRLFGFTGQQVLQAAELALD